MKLSWLRLWIRVLEAWIKILIDFSFKFFYIFFFIKKSCKKPDLNESKLSPIYYKDIKLVPPKIFFFRKIFFSNIQYIAEKKFLLCRWVYMGGKFYVCGFVKEGMTVTLRSQGMTWANFGQPPNQLRIIHQAKTPEIIHLNLKS